MNNNSLLVSPNVLKNSKFTPEEKFKIRAKNSNEKRTEIILSRSNSDIRNSNNSTNYHSNSHLNSNNINSNKNTNNQGNYTNYNGNNLILTKNSFRKDANSRPLASTNNNKFYRMPYEQRKIQRSSPIKSSNNDYQLYRNNFKVSSNYNSNGKFLLIFLFFFIFFS